MSDQTDSSGVVVTPGGPPPQHKPSIQFSIQLIVGLALVVNTLEMRIIMIWCLFACTFINVGVLSFQRAIIGLPAAKVKLHPKKCLGKRGF